jgi:hypothetical protein
MKFPLRHSHLHVASFHIAAAHPERRSPFGMHIRVLPLASLLLGRLLPRTACGAPCSLDTLSAFEFCV